MPRLSKFCYLFYVMIQAKLYITKMLHHKKKWPEKLIPNVYENLDDNAQLDIYDFNNGLMSIMFQITLLETFLKANTIH